MPAASQLPHGVDDGRARRRRRPGSPDSACGALVHVLPSGRRSTAPAAAPVMVLSATCSFEDLTAEPCLLQLVRGPPRRSLRPTVDQPRSCRRGRSASSRYCVVSRIVLPSCRELADRSPTARAGCGSRPVVGSSRKTTQGSHESLRQAAAGVACRRSRCGRDGHPRRRARSRVSSSPASRGASCGEVVKRPTIARFSRPVRFPSIAAFWPARPMRERRASASFTTSSTDARRPSGIG